jgi:hypothetical protein
VTACAYGLAGTYTVLFTMDAHTQIRRCGSSHLLRQMTLKV